MEELSKYSGDSVLYNRDSVIILFLLEKNILLTAYIGKGFMTLTPHFSAEKSALLQWDLLMPDKKKYPMKTQVPYSSEYCN